MKDRNTLGSSICDRIKEYIETMDAALMECEPYNSFDSEKNSFFVEVCKDKSAKILKLIAIHEDINERFQR